jgi:fucose permease
MSFAVRGDIMGDLGTHFSLTKEQIGSIAGPAFWGFTLAMVIGGPLCDVLGMGRLMIFAFIGHAVGILLTIFASGYTMLWGGTLAIGLANGFVEAACNPLVATLYPDEKIKRLNLFHVWFPGGIFIGGLLSYAISQMGLGGAEHGWQVKMGLMLIPLAIYGVMFMGKEFPPTERVASGISTGDMFRACLRPFFLLFALCMIMTAVTELGPGQWIPNILTVTTGSAGILFLAWQNGLMAVGRTFAGQLVHRISPSGVLLGSAIFSLLGLYLLSTASSAASGWIAVSVFAVGVCFFWPTMLGSVSERFPKTGSLGLAIMGGIGMLASSYAQPYIGKRYDEVTNKEALVYVKASTSPIIQEAFKKAQAESAGNDEVAAGKAVQAAAGDKAATDDIKSEWTKVQAKGGSAGLQGVVILPGILILIFGAIFFADKARGGYHQEVLTGSDE